MHKNRSVIEMGRTMLEHSGLPKRIWAEASATTVHILNCAPTSALPRMTPFEALTDSKPSCAHLRVFGYRARACTEGAALQVGPHIFLGYTSVSKPYRL